MSVWRSRKTQAINPERLSDSRIQRSRKFWQDYQWQIVLTLLALSLTLGYIGFYKFDRSIAGERSLTDLLYLTLQLTTLESGAVSGPVSWELEVARLLVPLVTASTAVLAAAVLFRKQLQMIHLWTVRKHVVICGLGEKGWLLASQFRQGGRDVVVVEKELSNTRNELCRDNGIIVIEGNAAELPVLRKAAVHRASHLVAVCGDDGVNSEVAMTTKQLSSARKNGSLLCAIHITSPQLSDLLREQEFGFETFPKFRLEMFNIFERGARILLSEYSPFGQSDEYGQATPNIVVVGLSRLGQSLVIQAARTWYETCAEHGGLLRISLIDKNAPEWAAHIQREYPKLPGCCVLTPYLIDLEDLQFQDINFLSNASVDREISSIFICLSDHTLGLQVALKLRQLMNRIQPPIVVRMDEESGMAKLLNDGQESAMTFHNIMPFGLIQRTCTQELLLGGTHEILAQAVHEDYLRNRLQEGLEIGQKRSMVRWNDLPEDLRESNRRQVDHIRMKLLAVGYGIKPLIDWGAARYQFTPVEIEKMAQMEHEHWMQERIRNGWQFASGPEDTRNKTHPDLQLWDKLPEPVKDKDRQPAIKLPALLARAGFQLYRLKEK